MSDRYAEVTDGLDEDQIVEVQLEMRRPLTKEQIAAGRRFVRASRLQVGNARDRRRAIRAVRRTWDAVMGAASRAVDYDWYGEFAAARARLEAK